MRRKKKESGHKMASSLCYKASEIVYNLPRNQIGRAYSHILRLFYFHLIETPIQVNLCSIDSNKL